MKKLMITVLLATTVTTAFAKNAEYISIGGKQITVFNNRESLVKLLGKAKKEVNGDTWHINGAAIIVNYNIFDGIADLTVYAEKPNHTPILLGSDNYKLTLGKDTIGNAVTKLHKGCFDVNLNYYGNGENNLTFSSRMQLGGNYYIEVAGSGNAETVKGLKSAKIDGFKITAVEPIGNNGCISQ